MKILHILQNPKIGGVQKFVLSLIPDSFSSKDTFSILFTRSSTGVLFQSFKSKNVQIINFPGKIRPFRPTRFYLWIKKHYHHFYNSLLPVYLRFFKPDIVHTHLYDLQEVSAHLHVSTKFNIPFIWTMHGNLESTAPGFTHLEKALNQAVKQKIPMVFVYVGAKPAILEDLLKYKGIQILHIPSGIDLDEFSTILETREVNRDTLGYSDDNFVFGYSGRLSWEKGVDVLISAFSQAVKEMTNLRLLIAGDGPERTKLEQMVHERNLENSIQLLGEINNIQEVLSVLDAYVQPSRTEGLPLSILEAMASRLPIIATQVGGIPALIEDGFSGLLVPPEDPVLLSSAMIKLAKDEDLRKRLSAASYQSANLYDISKIREQYINIYEQLVALRIG